ncbi:hypothetical protein P153DRAFT_263613, partial [Dothidotthia symphoricarpi CBS 119687]
STLNLLFLSLTWTTIAASYSPLQLEFFAPLVLRLTLYVIPSLLCLAFDTAMPSLALEIKTHGLPQRNANKGGIRTVALWSFVNVLLGVGVQAGVEWGVTSGLGMRSLLVIKGSRWTFNHLPNPWMVGKHAVVALLARNILQYYIHTHVLHAPTPNTLSRWHKSWHHSIRTPYSLAANYDHPVCHLLHRFLPLYLPAIALRMHILTYLALTALFSLEETLVYSGYSVLPSTIMLRGMARRTDAHMMSEGQGNFGPTGVLDWWHGTTLGKDVIEDLRVEAEKHDVKDRAGSTVSGVAGKIKDRVGNGSGRGKK